jgi:MFS family permease
VVAATMVAMTSLTIGTNLWLVRLIMLGLGMGTSFVFISAQAASMATVTKAQTGRASSIFNAGKQLGGAVGVALLTTVLAAAGPTRRVAGHLTVNLAAFHWGFLAAASVAVPAMAVALTIRDADAAATMVARHRRRTETEPATSGAASVR